MGYLFQTLEERRAKIEMDKEGFQEIAEKIERLNMMTFDAESKLEALSNKMDLINRTEKRLNELTILAEDVDVKIKALKSEEEIIGKANEQIGELRFLLGEVENKLNAYSSAKNREARSEEE
jgi:DNA repair exonuclease SbcCD ATPase subunit